MTTSTLDVRIMAHPARSAAATALRDRLGALDPLVVWDPAPDAAPSAQRTARLAWGTPARPGTTHRVVLQDDVSVPVDFADRLVALLERRPSRPLGLFASWGSRTGQAVRFAAYLGLDWAPVLGSALSATGAVLPGDLTDGYAQFLAGDADRRDSLSMYDFLVARGEPPVIVAPTLVEHDRPYRASMWPEKFVQGPRRSACFIDTGPGGAGRGGLDHLDVVPYLSPDTLRSTTAVYDRATGRFETVPSWRYARRLGLDTGELLGQFTHPDLAATRRALAEHVDSAFQYEVWLTGFLVGRTLTMAAGDPDLGTAAAQAASRTFVAGCLSRVLSLTVLERLSGATADLASHSILQGLASQSHRPILTGTPGRPTIPTDR